MDGKSYTATNEGCRLVAYRDTMGIWTIGYGCVGRGIDESVVWTQEQADDALTDRYATAVYVAGKVIGSVWADLDTVRQAALADMAYQLGFSGLARFVKMLDAISDREWEKARSECLDSLYAKQTPNRAARNASIFHTGQWPDQES